MKRFVIEFGYGVDLHGQDVNNAAAKAVKDAISHSCLSGLVEICGIEDLDEVLVDVVIACSRPEEIIAEKIEKVLPVGKKSIRAVKGGMTVSGLDLPMFGDRCDSIEVAVACITVSIL